MRNDYFLEQIHSGNMTLWADPALPRHCGVVVSRGAAPNTFARRKYCFVRACRPPRARLPEARLLPVSADLWVRCLGTEDLKAGQEEAPRPGMELLVDEALGHGRFHKVMVSEQGPYAFTKASFSLAFLRSRADREVAADAKSDPTTIVIEPS